MNEAIQLLLKFPSLLPRNGQLTEFDGYLNINRTDYEIHLSQVNGKPFLEINEKLSTFRQDIDHLSDIYTNPLNFLDALSETISSKTSSAIKKNLADFYRQVLTEYAEFREFYINLQSCVITPDLSEVSITTLDECDRQHALTVAIDGTFRIARHDLPDRDDFAKPSASLSVLYETFVKAIEELQPYLYLMDRFDSAAWVLDPETPKPKDCYRRIAFDSSISVVITVDPWKPDGIPSLQFLGPERLTNSFRSKVSSNVENWDYKADTFDEILRLLEMEHFPPKPTLDRGEVVLFSTGECCICFSSRLNQKLPEIVCTNPSCEQVFHVECLYQWLVSIAAKTRQTFNELHGECPNCEKHISCPLP
ncbi:hypothetical protein PPYR_04768 [Photinus pyralis]|uniref:RING-type domain-containing protein n=2 Tax=Photinus pyralis TaxID=7054 RepID=A0A5N4AYZ8_PHOPY|nr:E3 ubiquitin-protein ligase FANCL [Photinus pyralis]KAB0802582.1 hypothetical protein PPYR_04768 [Photinus pyralis]